MSAVLNQLDNYHLASVSTISGEKFVIRLPNKGRDQQAIRRIIQESKAKLLKLDQNGRLTEEAFSLPYQQISNSSSIGRVQAYQLLQPQLTFA